MERFSGYLENKNRTLMLFGLILMALGNSCTKDQSLNPLPRDYTARMTLLPSDTLRIPIGYRSNVYSKYIKKCEINGVPFLGVVNENTNELEFYSLTKRKEDFKIPFQAEGPNGVGSIRGFELISDSTLLIGSSLRIRLYVTDLEGNLQKTLKTDIIERKGLPFVQLYYTYQPLMFNRKKNDLFVLARADTDVNFPGKWTGTVFLKIPELDDESARHIFELPSHLGKYVHGAYFTHSSHLLMDDRYLVLAIPFYNDILIYDLETEELIEKPAGSKHFGDALPWDNAVSGMSESFYVPSNSYREIAYDKENQLLYRLAYQGVDYIGPDGQRRNWDNKPPSVIIINSDFEKIGEVDLPVNTIYTRMYFTHDGKLYLSLNHPDNNPSEDQMVFVGFKPEEL
ncbi:DUF4221 family protein [Cyclobacterium sp. SYSU L10401]|uniref:DUF4221 family protein n=1 Tax=Cyclobacterium sp. SYSU L10401 TaxID=2678657 RepID=UPI001F0990A4|nr:DUF4221 family protein [Cyclobacterium sp. SYSU L10401]